MYFRCIYHFLLALTLEFTFLYPALAQENTPNAQDLRNELPYQLMDGRIKEAVQHAKALIQLDRNSFLEFLHEDIAYAIAEESSSEIEFVTQLYHSEIEEIKTIVAPMYFWKDVLDENTIKNADRLNTLLINKGGSFDARTERYCLLNRTPAVKAYFDPY